MASTERFDLLFELNVSLLAIRNYNVKFNLVHPCTYEPDVTHCFFHYTHLSHCLLRKHHFFVTAAASTHRHWRRPRPKSTVPASSDQPPSFLLMTDACIGILSVFLHLFHFNVMFHNHPPPCLCRELFHCIRPLSGFMSVRLLLINTLSRVLL